MAVSLVPLCLQGDTDWKEREPGSQGSRASEGWGGKAKGRGQRVAVAWFRATGLHDSSLDS